jgi:hypothetical protein
LAEVCMVTDLRLMDAQLWIMRFPSIHVLIFCIAMALLAEVAAYGVPRKRDDLELNVKA